MISLLTLLHSGIGFYLSQLPASAKNYYFGFFLFIGIVFGIISTYYFIQSFRVKKVIIKLDEEGFHQLGTSIPWSGIAFFHHYYKTDIQAGREMRYEMIGLDLTEMARVLCGFPTPTATTAAELPGDIVVCQYLTDMSVSDLLALLEKYRIHYTQNNNARIGETVQEPAEEVMHVGHIGH